MTTHVHDHGELLVVLPFRLGYRPRRSIVAVALEDGRLGPMHRLGLPDRPDDGLDDASLRLSGGALGRTTREILLTAWEDEPGESLASLAGYASMCGDLDVAVRELLVVRGERWWSLDAAAGAPGPGRPLPRPRDVPAVADFVALGISPHPSLEALEREFEATVGDVAEVARLLDARRRRRRGAARATRRGEGIEAWARLLRPETSPAGGRPGRGPGADPVLDPRLVAAAVDVLADRDVRDALVDWLAPGALPAGLVGDAAAQVRGRLGPAPGEDRPAGTDRLLACAARLRRVAAATPIGDRGEVLAVYGTYAWWAGDGTGARIATDLALRLDPAQSLAAIVRSLAGLGVRPWAGRAAPVT